MSSPAGDFGLSPVTSWPQRRRRRLSWARTWPDVLARRDTARRLIGQRLVAVRYYDVDYLRPTLAPDHRGHRLIDSFSEWESPTWYAGAYDSIGFGVELQTASGRVFSVTWDPPGNQEGIGVEQSPLVGSAFPADAESAVWDVADRSRWQGILGCPIGDLRMHYRPWNDIHRPGAADAGPYWCRRISLLWDDAQIDLLLAEVDGPRSLRPCADNIAAVFEPGHLPGWS